jgi:release factor glutamine methyltransferase
MLDTTSGSGVLAVLAAHYGASGIAVDISPVAVENMAHNFKQSGARFEAIKSDVYDEVPSQKFDLIIANPPYLDGEIVDPWIMRCMVRAIS